MTNEEQVKFLELRSEIQKLEAALSKSKSENQMLKTQKALSDAVHSMNAPLRDTADLIRFAGVHVVEGTPVFSAKFREQHAGKEFVIADEFAEVSDEAWNKVYSGARANNANRPSLLRTICKIAARILFVILLVGVAVMVMV